MKARRLGLGSFVLAGILVLMSCKKEEMSAELVDCDESFFRSGITAMSIPGFWVAYTMADYVYYGEDPSQHIEFNVRQRNEGFPYSEKHLEFECPDQDVGIVSGRYTTINSKIRLNAHPHLREFLGTAGLLIDLSPCLRPSDMGPGVLKQADLKIYDYVELPGTDDIEPVDLLGIFHFVQGKIIDAEGIEAIDSIVLSGKTFKNVYRMVTQYDLQIFLNESGVVGFINAEGTELAAL